MPYEGINTVFQNLGEKFSTYPNILIFGQGGEMQLIGFAKVLTSSKDLANQLKTLDEYGCNKVFHGK